MTRILCLPGMNAILASLSPSECNKYLKCSTYFLLFVSSSSNTNPYPLFAASLLLPSSFLKWLTSIQNTFLFSSICSPICISLPPFISLPLFSLANSRMPIHYGHLTHNHFAYLILLFATTVVTSLLLLTPLFSCVSQHSITKELTLWLHSFRRSTAYSSHFDACHSIFPFFLSFFRSSSRCS